MIVPGDGHGTVALRFLRYWALAALAWCEPVAAQETHSGSVGISGDLIDSTIYVRNEFGLTGEKQLEFMRLAVSAAPADREELLRRIDAALPETTRFTAAAVAGFFKVLGEKETTPEQLPGRLETLAREQLQLKQQLAILVVDDPAVQALRTAASEALDAGNDAAARRSLSEARELVRTKSEALMEHLSRQQLLEAQLAAEQGGVALQQLKYREAASLFAEAAQILPSGNAVTRAGYLHSEAVALGRQGDEFADNEALSESIVVYRGLLDLSPEIMPLQDRIAAQHSMGNALRILGVRTEDVASLADAVKMHRQAKQACKLSKTENCSMESDLHLSFALQALGLREASTARLEEAVRVLEQAAHEVRPGDEGGSVDLANNLSAALRTLAWRQAELGQKKHAIHLLRRAVDQVRLALQMVRKLSNNAKREFLTAQGLGSSLQAAGLIEQNPGLVRGAIAVYQDSIAKIDRNRTPADWGSLQRDLGETKHEYAVALRTLGWMEGSAGHDGTAVRYYIKAKEAFEETLQIRTKERWPLDWAVSRMDLGQTLVLLGQNGQLEALADAVTTMRDALLELDSRRVQLDRAEMEQRLATALRSFGWQLIQAGRADEGVQKLLEAVERFRRIVQNRSREHAKFVWAKAQWDFGQALYQLGKQIGAQPLREAIHAYSESLLERPRPEVPQLWAQTTAALGAARWELGRRTGSTKELEIAQLDFCAAYKAYMEAGNKADALGLAPGMDMLDAEIAKMTGVSRATFDETTRCQ